MCSFVTHIGIMWRINILAVDNITRPRPKHLQRYELLSRCYDDLFPHIYRIPPLQKMIDFLSYGNYVLNTRS